MTYLEIRHNGKIVKQREVDSTQAKQGFHINVGSLGKVFVKLNEPATLGEYEILIVEEPPKTELSAKKEDTIPTLSNDKISKHDEKSSSNREFSFPKIEGYKILEPLGKGGMGTVWRAEQLSTKRLVALKLMASHAKNPKKAQFRFQREVELTARLDHPNIAMIYDSGLHQGMYYYAMELIDGKPLDIYVKEERLSRKQILRLMQKICSAVLYAHLHAVIHRDLKPSNILVDSKGEPHILDFGLAKALLERETTAISIEGQIAGTPAYMSPEQASGLHKDLDTRTDVFSLGVILYELLTDQSPHDLSGSVYDILHNITEGNITRPSQAKSWIDTELEAIILKALALDPEERYASAGMMAMDLKNYLEGEPLNAIVPTTLYFLRKKAVKYKKHVAVTAAILIILLTTIIIAYTKIVGARAVARLVQEQNKLLESEVLELRTKILSGNPAEIEAALGALEEKYRNSIKRYDQLWDEYNILIAQNNSKTQMTQPDTGFNFGKPVNLGGIINTPYIENSPVLVNNGLTLYFTSNREGSIENSEDIWVSTRNSIDEPWGIPENLGSPLNSPSREYMTSFNPNTNITFFSSNRGIRGNFDIYSSLKMDDGSWEEPNSLDPVNSRGDNLNPCFHPILLFFNSNRAGGYGRQDIWISTRAGLQAPWELPVNLEPPINSVWTEEMPFLALNNQFLLFVSDRPGGYGKKDIYISRRNSRNGPWSEPVNLGPKVNSSEDDEYPFILRDNSALIFSSKREGGSGDSDLWMIPIIPNLGFTFGEIVNLGSTINSSSLDWGYVTSSDELELYFLRNNPDGESDIYISRRTNTDEAWPEPENIGSTVNSDSNDGAIFITSDNLSLFFSSDRSGGFGDRDIWMTTRTTKNNNWAIPINLGPIINSSYHDGSPYLSEDGLTLYFDSDRPGGYGNKDLWYAARKTPEAPWNEPVNMGPIINTPESEANPIFSKDGTSIIFSSSQNNKNGQGDLWLTRRSNILESESWQPPINLGRPINSPRNETEPFVSEKGVSLFFTSNRDGGFGGYDIWMTSITQNHDLNRDGKINTEDLETLIENWGKGLSHADIAPPPFGDGQVDKKDIDLLLQYIQHDPNKPVE